jgi:hypothetical protein
MPRGTFRPTSLLLSAIASATVLSACSVVRPGARASCANVAARGDATALLDVVLELTNPGTTEIELVNYDYEITLADGSSYDGRWAALRALPPGQTVTAKVPAIVPVTSASAGARWTVRGTVSYRDPQSFARILYEAGILKTESSFVGEGTIADPSN